MVGAHRLKGKADFMYEDNRHVPLVIYHPEHKDNRRCQSITSHLLPTLIDNKHLPDDKFNRVDIKARKSKDEIILVEVQNTREIYYLERILYGVAKTITEHINLGQIYSNVKKVYSISILYFDIEQGSDYLYHGQNTL